MGIDIFYFADHNLPINSVNDFLREFSKRIGAEIRCANMSKTRDSYTKCKLSQRKNHRKVFRTYKFVEGWNFTFRYKRNPFCNESDLDKSLNGNQLDLVYKSGDSKFEYSVYGRNVFVRGAVDYYSKLDYIRYWGLFEKDMDEWFAKLLDTAHKHICPVFNSKQLLLTADSSSYEHETMAGELFGSEIHISDILERNQKFKNPCPVFTNKEIPNFPKYEGKEKPLILLDL